VDVLEQVATLGGGLLAQLLEHVFVAALGDWQVALEGWFAQVDLHFRLGFGDHEARLVQLLFVFLLAVYLPDDEVKGVFGHGVHYCV